MVQKERRIRREIYKRKLELKFEFKKKILKSILQNKNTLRLNNLYSSYLHRQLSINKTHNVCFLTGRFRGILKITKLSRQSINRLNREAKIQNMCLRSW